MEDIFRPGRYLSAKALLYMKLTAFLFLVASLQVSAKTFSQKVSFSGKNLSLERIFEVVKAQTGYDVLYNPALLRKTKPVSLSVKDVELEAALDMCFADQPVNFMIRHKTVVVITRPQPATIFPAPVISGLIEVTGEVRSETGEPLSGASVVRKGTDRGVMTDDRGAFVIDAEPGDILVISMVGYTPREMKIDGRRNINISLKIAENENEQVVVIGYGTQKKINLTGAVASVSGSTLVERPAPNLQNLLQGRIPGLTVVQPTGEPGRDAGSLQIRGLGSFGASSAPLVLIDGIEGSLENLSPVDIAGVTVLKDAASASIYGSRAANGVILITTRAGKSGTARLEYTNSFGTTSATRLPDLITNSATYMEMYNAALQRNGQPALYTPEQITAYRNGNGNPQFPNTDWVKESFHSAPIQSHNLALSGGDELSSYYISLGYLDQKGIMDGYNYKRYNSIINYNRKANKRVTVGTNINLSFEDALAPTSTNDAATLLAISQAPTFSNFLPDGSGRVAIRDYIGNGSPNWSLYEKLHTGFQQRLNYNIQLQGYLNVNILEGLDWKTTGAAVFFNQDAKFRRYPTQFPVYAFQPDADGNYLEITDHGEVNQLDQSSQRNLTLTVNSTITYKKDFNNDHHISLLAGYEQISNTATTLAGQRSNYTNTVINELNGGPTNGWNNSGDKTEYALQSLFGRVSYDYRQKYLVEGNLRYDGTSRVAPGHRWGVFGGVSAGWRLSEEDFLRDNVYWLDNLTLRASYGVLGNQSIGNYVYQQILNNTAYPFSSSGLSTAVVMGRLVDPGLHWEKTAITDIGIDISIFKGLLGATIDWYRKNTTEILAQQSDVPSSVGLSAPVVNAGGMVNKGFEIQLTHQHRIGNDFTYGANIMYSGNRNEVTYVLGGGNPGVFQIGLPYNSHYLYVWDGIFNTVDEISKSPAQPNSGNLRPGDLKIKDVTGDGEITPDDRVSFDPYPSYTYSFGVNAGWKGLRLAMFFQGVEGQKFNVNLWGFDPFIQGVAPDSRFLNAWTPENNSQTVPAVYQFGYPGVNGYSSTYSLLDASYLRLKNINISYSFTDRLLASSKWLKGLTVFVAGDNLITWTPYMGADPERAASGRYAQFPQLKTFSGGVKISL